MARVAEGFLLGTHYDLTFYLMDGNLYVRMKSSLSRKKVKYSSRFVRTMQSANELGRASKVAARVYRELSKEQRKMVFVLYKKMTGVAKLAFKYGKSEAEAEREVREYLVKMGVVKEEVKVEVVKKPGKVRVAVKNKIVSRKTKLKVRYWIPSEREVVDTRWKIELRKRLKAGRPIRGKAPPGRFACLLTDDV